YCRAHIMWSLAVALAVSCAPAAKSPAHTGGAAPGSIIEPYLRIHDALADDRLDGVKQHAGEIATAAAAPGAPALKIDQAAVQLAAAGDLNDARDRYGALSQAIVTYMKGLDLAAPEGVRTAWCPMVDKPWLQKGTVIQNPYYGKHMSTCGDFR